jgi:hypothetical protein
MEINEAEIIFQNAAINLSKNRLHFHTIQFLIKENNSKYNYLPYGSGVLVQIENYYLIFTASHVTETKDSKTLYILTRTGVNQIAGTCYKINKEKDEDTDLAYIVLDKLLGLLISETYQFLPLTKISHSHIPKESTNYMVCGYPIKNIWREEENIITGSDNFLLSMANEKIYNYYELNKEKYFILNFAGKGINIITGKKSKKIGDSYGLSGSGL